MNDTNCKPHTPDTPLRVLEHTRNDGSCKYCVNDATVLFQLYGGNLKAWVEIIPDKGAFMFFNRHLDGELDNIPIHYCPMCGRELTMEGIV